MPKSTGEDSPDSAPPQLQPHKPGARDPRAHFEEVSRILEEAERLRRGLSEILKKIPSAAPQPEIPDKIQAALETIEKHGLSAVKWADGFSALHWAAENGKPEICKFLLDKGADPKIADRRGRTPLDLATAGGHYETVSLFQPTDIFENMPEQFAKALEAIKAHGWKSLKWAGGWTALHWAAQEGRFEVVKYLVDVAGAPAGVLDRASRSPAFYAQKKGHSRIVDFLNNRIGN